MSGGWGIKMEAPIENANDFNKGDIVEILDQYGRPTQMKGRIDHIERRMNGDMIATVWVDGLGQQQVSLKNLQKSAQGRPQSDPFAMEPLGLREPGQTAEEAQRANSPAMKKTCPVCNSTCNPNDMNCHNCGASLSGDQQMVDRRAPDRKIAQLQQPPMAGTTFINPGDANSTSTDPNSVEVPGSMRRRIKRTPVFEELSDDFVDLTDEAHLNQVKESADDLGL